MRRDLESGGKWACTCEACVGVRSLIGVEKTLEMRPLVREIEEMESRLLELPSGEEKEGLMQNYCRLYDKLAEVMAK
jgi:hypothetical protein